MINIIKQVRLDNNLTQQQLADELGVTKSAVGNWEYGQRSPNKQILKAIADKYNYNLQWLLTGEGDKFKVITQDDDYNDEFITNLITAYKAMPNSRKIVFKEFCESFGIVDKVDSQNGLDLKNKAN